MDNVLTNILTGTASALLVAAIIGTIRLFRYFQKVIAKSEERSKRLSSAIQALYMVQVSQNHTLRALIELVPKDQRNGSVSRALEELREADKKLDEHSAKFAWK